MHVRSFSMKILFAKDIFITEIDHESSLQSHSVMKWKTLFFSILNFWVPIQRANKTYWETDWSKICRVSSLWQGNQLGKNNHINNNKTKHQQQLIKEHFHCTISGILIGPSYRLQVWVFRIIKFSKLCTNRC